MRGVVAFLSLGLGGLLVAVSLPAPRAEARATGTVRIGLVNTLGAGLPPSILQLVMRPFRSLMEEQTGLSGEIVSGGDPLVLAQKLAEDDVQVGVFHGHEFAWARAKYPRLEPIAICVSGSHEVRVHLVVRRDSGITKLADLENKSVALARLNRAHCRLFFERRCVPEGATTARFYRKISTPVEAEDALNEVVDRETAAAVVDAATLEAFRTSVPGRARHLVSLVESEPFPCGVIACYKGRFNSDDLRRFRVGLVGARETPRGKTVLRALRLTTFDLPPANYDDSLKAIFSAYPPLASK